MTWCGVGDGQKADCVIDDILKDDEPLHFLMRLTKIMLNEWKCLIKNQLIKSIPGNVIPSGSRSLLSGAL